MPNYYGYQEDPSRGAGGFGLNYDQGFGRGSRSGGMVSSYGPQQGAYQNFALQQQAANAQEKQFGIHESGETERANIAARAQTYGQDLKQSRFNQLFPSLQSQIGNLPRVGGGSGAGPTITAAPIWNEQQIQQQVNAGVSANDRRTANQNMQMANQMAGRGYASSSPLQQALMSQNSMQNLMANSDLARTTRWDAASGNAAQVLKGQTAQEQQFANRQQEDVERRKAYTQGLVGLTSSLASLLG